MRGYEGQWFRGNNTDLVCDRDMETNLKTRPS
jgi:hypothetical protein